jgi:hypothetical protein
MFPNIFFIVRHFFYVAIFAKKLHKYIRKTLDVQNLGIINRNLSHYILPLVEIRIEKFCIQNISIFTRSYVVLK